MRNKSKATELSARRAELLDQTKKLEADAASDQNTLATVKKEIEVIDLQITK